MKIIVDAFGGDNAPAQIIKGAIDALDSEQGFSLTLVGKQDVIERELLQYKYDPQRVSIHHAPDVITNDDSPAEAVRTMKDSSIVQGFRLLNSDPDYSAFVSAGSTGAVLSAAVILVKRIKGINRPALAPVLPTVNNSQVVLVDCGANPDSKANNLVQFALMGSVYSKEVLGIPNPKVGLLSNGAEDSKGNELNKEAFPLLKEDERLNFVGNIEARDILSGKIDVVAADGFGGNIALKASEGAALAFLEILKKGILAGGLRAKLGYLLLKPVFKMVKNTMDYNDKGGAVLLGLQKIVVKSHGSSKAKSITASILQAKNLVEAGVAQKIEKALMI
ncbi:MAG: phosphate acyltransferase PlsX [Clostridia bacterium]